MQNTQHSRNITIFIGKKENQIFLNMFFLNCGHICLAYWFGLWTDVTG